MKSLTLYFLLTGLWVSLLATHVFGIGELRQEFEPLVEELVAAEASDEVAWEALDELFSRLGYATDIEAARELYLEVLNDLDGGLTWVGETAVSAFFQQWLEDALTFVEAPADLATLRYWLARHLHAQPDAVEQADRIGLLYEAAIDARLLPDDTFWTAKLYFADWAEHYGIQSFDSQGAVQYEPDYEKARAVYGDMLENLEGPDETAREEVVARIESLSRSELEWLEPKSFFPETDVQVRLRSRNVEQVHVELHAIDDLEALEIGDEGELGIRPDLQRQSEPVYQTVFSAQTQRPHYRYERTVNIPALEPGAYQLRARGGEEVVTEWVWVADFSLVVQRDEQQLRVLPLHAETGRAIEGVALMVWLEDDDGKWTSFQAEIDAPGMRSFALPEENWNGRFRVAAKWQDRICFVSSGPWRQHRAQSAQVPSWNIYTDRLKRRHSPDNPVQWRGIPQIDSGWTPSAIDWERPLRAVWLDPDGETVAESEVEVAATHVVRGQLQGESDWKGGLYHLQLKGWDRDGRPWESLPAPAFYQVTGPDPRIRAAFNMNPEGAELVPVFGPGQPVDGQLTLNMRDGTPLPAAQVELRLRDAPDGEVRKELKGLQTDADGMVDFHFDEVETDTVAGLLWLEARIQTTTAGRFSEGQWIRVSEQSFEAELTHDRRIFQPGDQLRMGLRMRAETEIPARIDGTLILNRERWQSTYVHRRRGNEIRGNAYRELPERSLLGTSQGDYRLSGEGFITEEVRRMDVRVEDGRASLTLPAGDPGFYRMSWIAPVARGQTVQADTQFWVVSDGEGQMSYRPDDLEIISDRSRLSRNNSNRMLIASPHLNSYSFLSRGDGNGHETNAFELVDRTQWFDLDLSAHAGTRVSLELNSVHQGQWLRDRKQFPVVGDAGSLDVTIERDSDYLTPGQSFRSRVRVGGLNEQKGSGQLYVFLRRAEEMPVRARMESFAQTREREMDPFWQTVSIIDAYPFPGSLQSGRVEESVDDGCPRTRRMLQAELANLPMRSAAVVGWQVPYPLDESGEVAFTWNVPDHTGDWVIEFVAVNDRGWTGRHREWVSTQELLEVEVDHPGFVRVGDQMLLRLQAANAGGNLLEGKVNLQVLLDGEALRIEREGFDIEANSSLSRSWQVIPDREGTLEIRVLMESSHEPVRIDRSIPVHAGRDSKTVHRAHALAPASLGEELTYTSMTDNPWALLGKASKAAESRDPISIDELAMQLFTLSQLDEANLFAGSQREVFENRRSELVQRLVEQQNRDGGWPWVEGTRSDPWTSALTLWALTAAVGDEDEGSHQAMERVRSHLLQELMREGIEPHLLAWILQATAHYQVRFGSGRPERMEARGFLQLIRDQKELDPEVQAMLLVVAYLYRFEEEVVTLTESLVDRVGKGGELGVADSDDRRNRDWRYQSLNRLLWFRGLSWGHPEQRLLTLYEPMVVEDLFPGGQRLLKALFAQAVYSEYLMLQGRLDRDSRTQFHEPEWMPWDQAELGSIVADPLIYLLSEYEPARASLRANEWDYTRTGELRRLTPTLLRGLTEEVQPWTDDEAVIAGSRLSLSWVWTLPEAMERVRIRLPIPAGWIPLPADGGELIRAEPDELTARQEYLGEEESFVLDLPEIPAGNLRLSLTLQAQSPGRFQLFSPQWFSQDAADALVFEEPVIIEISADTF